MEEGPDEIAERFRHLLGVANPTVPVAVARCRMPVLNHLIGEYHRIMGHQENQHET